MIDISAHITMQEATRTSTGIPNLPDVATIQRMQYVAQTVFEPLRAHFGVPIKINSFYRSPAVNKAVGGAATSQHVAGEAIDLHCDTIPDKVIFDYIRQNLPHDQVIHEPTWVHVSLRNGRNRNQALIAKKVNGKMIYTAV